MNWAVFTWISAGVNPTRHLKNWVHIISIWRHLCFLHHLCSFSVIRSPVCSWYSDSQSLLTHTYTHNIRAYHSLTTILCMSECVWASVGVWCFICMCFVYLVGIYVHLCAHVNEVACLCEHLFVCSLCVYLVRARCFVLTAHIVPWSNTNRLAALILFLANSKQCSIRLPALHPAGLDVCNSWNFQYLLHFYQLLIIRLLLFNLVLYPWNMTFESCRY